MKPGPASKRRASRGGPVSPEPPRPEARPPAPEHAGGHAEVVEGEIVDLTTAATAGELVAGAEATLLPGDSEPGALGEALGEATVPAAGVAPGAAGGRPDPYVPLARGRGALVRSDPLSLYLAEISRFERLSAQEERDLAMRYRAAGDREAAARLVTSHLRLVVAVAMGFRRAVSNLLDLIQEGNIGLMEAVERFDPLKGTRLSTYATWWIRSRIIRYLLDNWRLVRVGTTNARRKLLYNLRAEQERLVALGITPTPRLLAGRLGTTPEDVVAVSRALGASDVSLDAPVGEDGTTPRGELVPGSAPSPERQAVEAELRAKLQAALDAFAAELSPREAALLRRRLLADEPVTLQVVADEEGVTREAVRQTEVRLRSRLQAFLRERFPDAGDISLAGD